VRLDGSATLPLRANFTDTPRVSLELDTGSTAGFTDDGGAIFDLTRDLMVAVQGSNSSLDLTADSAGGAFVVDTRALNVTTAGTTVHVAPTLWEDSGDRRKTWIARSEDAGITQVQYKVGDLAANTAYDVKRDDAAVGTFTAGADGTLQFSDTPGTGSTVTYALTKSANQPPQSGGGEGGGGGGGSGDLAWLMGLLVALGRRRLSRGA
jgi:hypothetical protein